MNYEIQMKKIEDENSKLKAAVTVTFGNAFVVKGIKLYEGEKGLFVSMPNYKRNEPDAQGNEYKDICYPITADFRKELEEKIVEKYHEKEMEQELKITDCRISILEKDSLIGLASVTLDNLFVVGNIKIVNGEKGLFVSMPNYKVDEEYKDICFPTTASFREKLNTVVLEKYQEIVQDRQQDKNQSQDAESINNRPKKKSR
jgi:DNA-binding cell septation regulator SpoVG